MKLIELCQKAGMFCPAELYDTEISSVTCDSRRVQKGSLFVCIRGLRSDGNDFVDDARRAGAAAILSDKRTDVDLSCKDADRAFAFLCRRMYGHGIEKLKLVGVTGTNGKTSVCAMLRSIFSAAGYRTGSIGTLGCFSPLGRIEEGDAGTMTTPDTERLYKLLSRMAEDGAEYVFMELSSHALALKKADALRFSVGIFTNFTRDHLDFHKNEENYFEAKKRIFELCDTVIVNKDDRRLACLKGVKTCSARSAADFCAEEIRYYGTEGCGYGFLSELCRFGIVSRIPGRFTVMNTLLASACAVTLGIDPIYIKKGIYELSSVDGRLERVELDGADFSVYIDYAHTPDALENILLTAKGFAKGEIILVFGCGGDRDRGKRPQMAKIATRLADRVIITEDNCRSESPEQIFEDILSGVDSCADFCVIRDRSKAIENAVFCARSGDVILLAGKGHEKYEIDAEGKHDFDEAELVKKAYKLKNYR